jgi:beta-barrel assembly-enhancing protease
MRSRLILFVILVSTGLVFVYALFYKSISTQYETTLAPFYQIMGKPAMLASQSVSKLLNIKDKDEKSIGQELRKNYIYYVNVDDPNYKYLNSLIKDLSIYKTKDFAYEVYILDSGNPNAFAIPGGIIFVTSGLLSILEDESEIISILLHEMAHIEKNHCIESVRFQLAAKKIKAMPLGELADFIYRLTLKHSYSKTQEDEADSYAFSILKETDYDIYGVSNAFAKLEKTHLDTETRKAHILNEYFQSHPHITLRKDKFYEKAKFEIKLNPNKVRYKGQENFSNKIPLSDKKFNYEKMNHIDSDSLLE